MYNRVGREFQAYASNNETLKGQTIPLPLPRTASGWDYDLRPSNWKILKSERVVQGQEEQPEIFYGSNSYSSIMVVISSWFFIFCFL